jgi:hypothetical protein
MEAMWATSESLRTMLLMLGLGLVSSTRVYSQTAAPFPNARIQGTHSARGAWPAKCFDGSFQPFVDWRTGFGAESPWSAAQPSDEWSLPNPPTGSCVGPDVHDSAQSPCRWQATRNADLPQPFPCAERVDAVPTGLTSLGKAGMKIERAREEILNILRSQNGCTEWFESKDTTPEATFQSLRFSVDQHGPTDISELNQGGTMTIFRHPYVAQATQDGGGYTTITINTNGAFYRSQGNVQKINREGGPVLRDGARVLTVGIYVGNTLEAQMVTLLHEFGHIIDLLPQDADDLDGQSARNTNEVLRHCRSEVEARAKQAKQMARR